MSLEPKPALKLPVIDFTSRDLKPGTVEWDSVSGDVRRALEEYGCFEALFDKVTVELRKAVFEASEELFRLPLETKQRIVSDVKYRGYVGQNPTNPLYEGVGIDVADNEEKVKAFTQKVWPQGNMSFRFYDLLKISCSLFVHSLGSLKTYQNSKESVRVCSVSAARRFCHLPSMYQNWTSR